MSSSANPPRSALALLCASVVALLIAAVPVRAAVTLVWGNELGSTNLTSSGTAALDSSFSAALGTFAAGFTPTSANTAQWEANWLGAATAVYSVGDSYFSGQTPMADNSLIPAGAPLYIWVRNSAPLEAGGEWFLATDDSSDGNATDNWAMPNTIGTDQTTRPVHFEISCSPTDPLNVIFGGVGDNGSGVPIQSGGLYSDPSMPEWCLQTHTLTAVPEPGSALLVLAATLSGALRRRRNS